MSYFDKKYLVFYIAIFIVIFAILVFASSPSENFADAAKPVPPNFPQSNCQNELTNVKTYNFNTDAIIQSYISTLKTRLANLNKNDYNYNNNVKSTFDDFNNSISTYINFPTDPNSIILKLNLCMQNNEHTTIINPTEASNFKNKIINDIIQTALTNDITSLNSININAYSIEDIEKKIISSVQSIIDQAKTAQTNTISSAQNTFNNVASQAQNTFNNVASQGNTIINEAKNINGSLDKIIENDNNNIKLDYKDIALTLLNKINNNIYNITELFNMSINDYYTTSYTNSFTYILKNNYIYAYKLAVNNNIIYNNIIYYIIEFQIISIILYIIMINNQYFNLQAYEKYFTPNNDGNTYDVTKRMNNVLSTLISTLDNLYSLFDIKYENKINYSTITTDTKTGSTRNVTSKPSDILSTLLSDITSCRQTNNKFYEYKFDKNILVAIQSEIIKYLNPNSSINTYLSNIITSMNIDYKRLSDSIKLSNLYKNYDLNYFANNKPSDTDDLACFIKYYVMTLTSIYDNPNKVNLDTFLSNNNNNNLITKYFNNLHNNNNKINLELAKYVNSLCGTNSLCANDYNLINSLSNTMSKEYNVNTM